MKPTTWYAVQPFVTTKKGRYDAGGLRQCNSAEGAMQLAQRLVDTGAAIGALAYSRYADIDNGNYDEPEILSRVGRIPEDDSDVPF